MGHTIPGHSHEEDELNQISREMFMCYEAVRESGVTNMMDVRTVEKLSGLSQETILTIIRGYSELADKWLP